VLYGLRHLLLSAPGKFLSQSRLREHDVRDVELSRTGRVWSYTNACYEPPEPFVAPKPFEPFAIAAVELEREKMIVLGQVVAGVGVEELEVGLPMELVLETLYRDGDTDKLIWKWKPAGGAR
jgi:uncharacterized OB-fold protein